MKPRKKRGLKIACYASEILSLAQEHYTCQMIADWLATKKNISVHFKTIERFLRMQKNEDSSKKGENLAKELYKRRQFQKLPRVSQKNGKHSPFASLDKTKLTFE